MRHLRAGDDLLPHHGAVHAQPLHLNGSPLLLTLLPTPPALEAAFKRAGNDRDTLLRIYELQGIVFATLNETAKATKVFTTLTVLDPDHKLSGDYPPRVTHGGVVEQAAERRSAAVGDRREGSSR